MIQIKRNKCPEVLNSSKKKGTHYNKKPVVKILWEMQHEKCCYCEQKIPEEGHLKAVDHFKPKSIFKHHKNDWKNLLLACAQCNGKKSDKFPVVLSYDLDEPKVVYLRRDLNEKPLIMDPSDPNIDPEKHIDFEVDDIKENCGLIKEKNHSELGRITIEVTGLTSYYYTDKRYTFYLNSLFPTYTTMLSAKHNGHNQLFEEKKDIFRMWMSAKGEFAAFVRAFARFRQFDTRFEMDIPVGADI